MRRSWERGGVIVGASLLAILAACSGTDQRATDSGAKAASSPHVDQPVVTPVVATTPAEAIPALPPGGVELIGAPQHGQAMASSTPGFTWSRTPEGTFIASVATVSGRPWNAQLKWVLTKPMPASTCYVTMRVRCLESVSETGQGTVGVFLQQAGPPWQSFATFDAFPGREWQDVRMPATVNADDGKHGIQLAINLGAAVQRIEIADPTVVCFPPTVKRSDLPSIRRTYIGRESDAAWRAPAEARIRTLRTAPLTVRVIDAQGKPVPGATVAIQQQRSTFPFGTCVTRRMLLGADADAQRYREVLYGHFNQAVFEGEMKWVPWDNPDLNAREIHRRETSQAVDLLISQGFTVRGHCLVWPGWGTKWALLPADLKPLVATGDKAAVSARIDGHIRDIMQTFQGRVPEWDVINEPVQNHVLQDLLGREAMADWFRIAHQADPSARLFLNDYTMLSGGAVEQARIDAFYDNVQFLQQQGAPLHGIGEQAHFDDTLVGIPRMLNLLDRFAALGVRILITEFDHNTADEQLQADYLRDFYTAAFSHPAVDGILMWGFWESRHWKPDAALWRKDWSIKPAGAAYADLVQRRWRTDQTVTTGADGSARIEGFLGSYRIAVPGSAPVAAELARDGATVEITR